ncbi:Uncharacterised protein [Vibrio cholerae]|nr:Uncharacterised protein [Vibrio cholerae]
MHFVERIFVIQFRVGAGLLDHKNIDTQFE